MDFGRWFWQNPREEDLNFYLKCQEDKYWTYREHNAYGKEFKFYRTAPPVASEGTQNTVPIKEIDLPIQKLLDGWKKASSEADKKYLAKTKTATVAPASSSTTNEVQEQIKLIISVFFWNAPSDKEQKKEIKSVTNDLVSLVTTKGSWLAFHGTKETFPMLGRAMKDHTQPNVVAVKSPPPIRSGESRSSQSDKTKIEEREKNFLSKAMKESNWLEKYVICEDMVDICGKTERSEGVFECSVIISGNQQQVMSAIEASVSKRRPVILVQGLGGVVDNLVSLIENKKDEKPESNTTYQGGTSRSENRASEPQLADNKEPKVDSTSQQADNKKQKEDSTSQLAEKKKQEEEIKKFLVKLKPPEMELLYVFSIHYCGSEKKKAPTSDTKKANAEQNKKKDSGKANNQKNDKEDSGKASSQKKGKEDSGKASSQELDKEDSRKASSQEQDIEELGKASSPEQNKKKDSGKANNQKKDKEDSGKASSQKKDKEDSGKASSQKKDKEDSGEASSQEQDKKDSRKANVRRESIKEKILDVLLKCLKGRSKSGKTLLLKMCIEWNEYELAEKEELLPKECKDLKKETLAEAFGWRREKFIKYILDHNLDVDEEKEITVKDIDTWYCKYYENRATIQKNLQNAVRELIPSFSFTQKDQKEEEGTKNQGEKEEEEEKKEKEEEDKQNLSRRNIFILSLLIEKPELLEVTRFQTLDHINEKAAAALFACGLLKAIARTKGKYWHHYQKYQKRAGKFGEKAEEIINGEFVKSHTKSYLILRQRLAAWGNMSLMHLAMETRNMSFLKLEPCHKILEKVWVWGDAADAEILLEQKAESQGGSETRADRKTISALFPPRVMYFFNLLALLLFLMAFALLIVSKLETERFHFLEWVVLTTVITFLMQEIGQLYKKYIALAVSGESGGDSVIRFFTILGSGFLSYTKDYFNAIDFSSVAIYTGAFAARVIAYNNPGNATYMDASRVIFSVNFVVFTLRLLRFCYISESLGPVVHMITKMVKILLQFLVILTIFFLAYAVASEAVLYPESKMSWALVFHVLRKAYWSMYGEFFLDELEADGSDHCTQCTTDPNMYDEYDQLRCASQTGRYIVPVFLGIYVLIVNILLLNLLIALFSSAVADVKVASKELWSYQRAVMLREFSRYILPFPFTPLTILLWYVRQPHDPFSYASAEEIKEMENLLPGDKSGTDSSGKEKEEPASVEGQLKELIKELQRKDDSCKYRCVCEKNQKTLERLDEKIAEIEKLLRRQSRTSYRDPEPRSRLRHTQSWDPSIRKPYESPRRGAHTHFYVVNNK